MELVHLVARMRPPFRFLADHEHAAWLWGRLRASFPRVVAVCLMSDHPHLLLRTRAPEAARRRLARVLGHFQRRVRVPRLWGSVPPVDRVPRDKAARVARYIELNPCRAGLIDHPLGWTWSTLRDLVHASASPWATSAELRRALPILRRPSVGDWLEYVCSDDTVHDRRPLAAPATPTDAPRYGLDAIAAAACAATRASVTALEARGLPRILFLQLARDQGHGHTGRLARICGMTARGVRKALADLPEPAHLDAARLCLADPRLRSRVGSFRAAEPPAP